MKINLKKVVSLKTLEKFIQQNIDEIQHMDDVTLPDVLVELQAEQAEINGLNDHKSITHIEVCVIEKVFVCWMGSEDGQKWLSEMLRYDHNLKVTATL